MRSASRLINEIASSLNPPLVLVDVGAALEVHADFAPLRSTSTVLAFDADEREIPKAHGTGLRVFNKAVAEPDAIRDGRIAFYLTKNPTLSSSLKPDPSVAGRYSFARRFDTVRQADVPAMTLEDALDSDGYDRIDWLKLDTQGTDGRLISSLSPRVVQTLMCVDVEPGIDQFYCGEDTFTQVHELMRSFGFWLAGLVPMHAARISRSAFAEILPAKGSLVETAVDISLTGRHPSPIAVMARYLRDPERSALDGQALRRLWTCAFAAGFQPFAFEVARILHQQEASPESLRILSATRKELRKSLISPLHLARRVNYSHLRRIRIRNF